MHIEDLIWEDNGRPQGTTLLYIRQCAEHERAYSRVATCGRPLARITTLFCQYAPLHPHIRGKML